MNMFSASRISRWRSDLQIAGSWANTPLIYMTFSELLYNNSRLLKILFPSHAVYLLASALIFIPLFKVVSKVIIRLGLYGAEIKYRASINPYSTEELTPKERTLFHLSIASADAAIAMLEEHNVTGVSLTRLQETRDDVQMLLEGVSRG